MGDDEWLLLADDEFVLSPARCAEYLELYVRPCPIGEATDELPWIRDDPRDGHGHTDCLFIGWAIHHLRSMDFSGGGE